MPFPVFVLASMGLAASTVAAAYFSPWRWLAVGASLLGATALLLVQGLAYFDYYADDAYITLRYSRHLADGLGPNWNAEGRVEGYTSFLWMGTLAGLAKIGCDLVVTSMVFGALATVATFVAVSLVWRRWADQAPASGIQTPAVLAAALLLLALTDGVPFWGFSGMETPLFMALLTLGACLYLREAGEGQLVPWSAVALAAAAMTRPEGLIAAAVTGAFVLAELAPADDRQRAVTRVLAWGGTFVLLYGGYFTWRYAYYDYLLPNTYYAKVGATRAILERGLEYVQTYGLRYQLLPLLAGTAVLLLSPRLRRDAAYVLALSAAMLAGVAVEGGDDFPHGRFIVPLLPLLYLAAVAGGATLLRRLSLDPARAALVTAALLSLAGLSLLRGAQEQSVIIARERVAIDERRDLGAWLNEHAPPDYTIAALAVGAIGYYAEDRAMLDLLGLNDVVIAHADVPGLGEGLAGHEKYDIDYVLEVAQPEIIVTNDADAAPLSEERLRPLLSSPSPVRGRQALLTDPRLWERYDVRSLEIEGRWFNFFQRADTIDELEGPGLR